MHILRRKSQGKDGDNPKKSLRARLQQLFGQGRRKSGGMDKIKVHTHDVEGETARVKGHKESISLTTGEPVITKDGHVHEYGAVIPGGQGPGHSVEGVTTAADVQGREHIHIAAGHTSRERRHAHAYQLETSGGMPKKRSGTQCFQRKRRAVITQEITAATLPVEPD